MADSTQTLPLWEKANLTLEEAAAYYGIRINQLSSLTDVDHGPYVLGVGRDSSSASCLRGSGKPVFGLISVAVGALIWYNKVYQAPDIKERFLYREAKSRTVC